ncbi:hypothetical protein JB92DRAFT_2733633 [Gautieria morchelliformis]|nr:hypothetical protein JB92DRAFT_2733633 [Gautieria morchelliformis]
MSQFLAQIRFITSARHRAPLQSQQTRFVSSSPYGRTHVWKHRRPKLPNPIVPIFPQRVVLSDGSSFTHYTTSPRSRIRLTRDLTNNPLWNNGMNKGGLFEDEEGSSGRMGRFRRKFEEFSSNLDWVAEEGEVTSELVEPPKEGKTQ